ncbi:MAG: DUF5615 family PIN-like protein [Nitrospira sp.]|nr:DUF5615 family PIN-like protein [Nitrospira sp.]
MGIALSTVQTLRKAGHDIRHLSEDGLERLSDSSILEKAGREGSIVITCDLDFADLLALGAHTLPSVILLRLYNRHLALSHLDSYTSSLNAEMP